MKIQSNEKIETLKNKVKGQIVLPGDPNYNEVREIWNAMIDRQPAVIVQCAEADDVPHAISYARENGLEISIRGGGHNIAGSALCDNGVVIDFSNMTTVSVDAQKRSAYVEPGATLGDFDKAVQAHGLATPVGINSTTGIAGLTLGGGFGWLTRKYGMTIDNLVSAEMVTADGRKIHVSEDENTDLFWAIRGGGGNFGVVTQFEFALYPVGPEILAGLLVFPIAQAKQVLEKYREFVKSAPEELNIWVVLRKAPPLPFLPENVHGKEVIVLAIFYAGDIAKGEKLINPLRSFGDAYGEHIGAQPSLALSHMHSGSRPLTRCSRPVQETTGNPIISRTSVMARWIRLSNSRASCLHHSVRYSWDLSKAQPIAFHRMPWHMVIGTQSLS